VEVVVGVVCDLFCVFLLCVLLAFWISLVVVLVGGYIWSLGGWCVVRVGLVV